MIKETLYRNALIRDYELFRCPVTGAQLEERGDELMTIDGKHRYKLFDCIPEFASATIADNLKQSVQDFWNNCPNESAVSKKEIGSPEFYEETENHRYRIHRDFDQPFLKKAIDFGSVSGKRVLEIGCGIGMDAIQFARQKNDMYLIDLSLNSLRITLGRFQNEGFRAHACVADAENLPLPPESFDVVYSYGVLHHSPDTQRSISEVHRVLKPGGRAIIMLYSKNSAMTFFNVGLHHGVRKGQLLRLRSWEKLLSNWTELQSRTETSVNPVTQAFTIRQCKEMFRNFSASSMKKHYVTEGHFAEAHYLLKMAPKAIRQQLPDLFGWNIIIHAVK